MKPVVALDVDGVIANFLGHTLYYMKTSNKPSPYDESNWPQWEITDVVPEHKDWLRTIWAGQGFCETIPPYEDAVEGVLSLASISEVHFVTSPAWYSKHWMPERYEWLEKHFGKFIPIKERLTFTRAKHKFNCDVFVDDNFKTVMKHPNCETMTVWSLLWARPYNRIGQYVCPSISYWSDLKRIVESVSSDLTTKSGSDI